MGLLRTAMRAGIAKKLFDEARKPRNQAKAKQLFAQITGKGGNAATKARRRA